MEIFQSWTKTTEAEWKAWFRSQGTHLPWLELVKLIQDNKNLRPPTVAIEFWKRILGNTSQQADNGDFLRGFVEGAVDLWAKVQEHL